MVGSIQMCKTTTSRAFRKKNLNRYTVYDFDNFEDYFLYLHLNPQIQWIHVLGGVAIVPVFPWVIYALIHLHQPLPFVLFSLVFYGAGFISHWTGDGQISKTVKAFGPSYLYVILLNFRIITGSQKAYEARFMARYPHTLWVYQSESEAQAIAPPQNQRRAQIGLGLLALLGLGLTQVGPLLVWGWGLVLLSLYLAAGFLLVYLQDLEHAVDLLDQPIASQRLALTLALSQQKQTAVPAQQQALADLQIFNSTFWYRYRQSRWRQLKAWSQGAEAASSSTAQPLAQAWLQRLEQQLQTGGFAVNSEDQRLLEQVILCYPENHSAMRE
ncbi:MAG: hypothetical protein IV090_08010 [Candidatus Sericytochromatia bacterium]|nr:hypothetical protein [Candidatus Sericytochromatia bacterium]